MREIRLSQIVVFCVLAGGAALLGLVTTWLLLGRVPLGDFRGVALSVAAVLSIYLYAILTYRIFLRLFPLEPGEIAEASPQEFVYHVHLLFFLLLFYPLTRSGVVPVPLMRLVYLALGARLGKNTYSSGIIFDPLFVVIGDNTIVGQSAVLVPHAIEGRHLSHAPIRIGSNVTIGVNAVLLGGVVVGDGAIVATGAVVGKGTQIGPGEIWAGTPARRLKAATDESELPRN